MKTKTLNPQNYSSFYKIAIEKIEDLSSSDNGLYITQKARQCIINVLDYGKDMEDYPHFFQARADDFFCSASKEVLDIRMPESDRAFIQEMIDFAEKTHQERSSDRSD